MATVEFSFDLPDRWKQSSADDETVGTECLSLSHGSLSPAQSRSGMPRSGSERSLALSSRSGSERSLNYRAELQPPTASQTRSHFDGGLSQRSYSERSLVDITSESSSESSDPEPVQRWRSRVRAKLRRFSLAQSELHESTLNLHDSSSSFSFNEESEIEEAEDAMLVEMDSKQYKMVRFSVAHTKRHEGPTMSEEEWSKCFYDKDSIKKFKDNASKAVKDLVTKKEGLAAALFGRSAQEHDIAQSFADAYNACRRAKSERAMRRAGNLVHREALAEIYKLYDLAGLEKHFLDSLRAGSSGVMFRCFILQHVQQEQQESVLAHFVHNTSRPSRLMAQELARAQAAAALDAPAPRRTSRRQSTKF